MIENSGLENVNISELVIPSTFAECMSYEEQIMFLNAMKQNKLIAGDNITLINNENGTVTIKATGGSSGGYTYSLVEVAPSAGFSKAYILRNITTGSQAGVKIEIPIPLKGDPGDPGAPGTDGFSPVANVEQTASGAVITITDKNGTTTATLFNGAPGAPGTPGAPGQDGNDGFSPVITTTQITGGHRVTITDATGTSSFDVMDGNAIAPSISAAATVGSGTGTPSVNVVKTGTDAAPTFTFNFDNLKGTPGTNGTDGVSPTITVRDITGGHQIEIVSAGGTERFDIMDGVDGTDGTDGTDGVSPTITVRDITGGHQIEIVSAGGTERFDVMDGTDGTNGTNGVDGVGISSITFKETDAQGNNVYTITLTNSNTYDITAPRGPQGVQGKPGTNGTNGTDGVTPSITAAATVGSGTGTPSVNVVKTGTDAAPTFTFNFDNLKGDPASGGAEYMRLKDYPSFTFSSGNFEYQTSTGGTRQTILTQGTLDLHLTDIVKESDGTSDLYKLRTRSAGYYYSNCRIRGLQDIGTTTGGNISISFTINNTDLFETVPSFASNTTITALYMPIVILEQTTQYAKTTQSAVGYIRFVVNPTTGVTTVSLTVKSIKTTTGMTYEIYFVY